MQLRHDMPNSKTVRYGPKLVSLTNRKLHTSFRSVLKSLTLSDLERSYGRHYALFHTIAYDIFRSQLTKKLKVKFTGTGDGSEREYVID